MTTYTKIRFLLGLGAIFAFVYLLNGMPCLGDANELNGTESNIRMLRNNSILPASYDEDSLGQSLVVPKLSESELDKVIWGVFPRSMFEEVESIGRRHILTDKGKHYVVKEGDSLWSIAAEKLGDPSRYKEISKLNTDVLKNDHDLTIGMRLSLPDK
jgi:nucleoid-associated protein YgaU